MYGIKPSEENISLIERYLLSKKDGEVIRQNTNCWTTGNWKVLLKFNLVEIHLKCICTERIYNKVRKGDMEFSRAKYKLQSVFPVTRLKEK